MTGASELSARIGRVAQGALAAHGVTRYEHLHGWTADDLRRIHGVGPKAIAILTEELAERGQALAD